MESWNFLAFVYAFVDELTLHPMRPDRQLHNTQSILVGALKIAGDPRADILLTMNTVQTETSMRNGLGRTDGSRLDKKMIGVSINALLALVGIRFSSNVKKTADLIKSMSDRSQMGRLIVGSDSDHDGELMTFQKWRKYGGTGERHIHWHDSVFPAFRSLHGHSELSFQKPFLVTNFLLSLLIL